MPVAKQLMINCSKGGAFSQVALLVCYCRSNPGSMNIKLKIGSQCNSFIHYDWIIKNKFRSVRMKSKLKCDEKRSV